MTLMLQITVESARRMHAMPKLAVEEISPEKVERCRQAIEDEIKFRQDLIARGCICERQQVYNPICPVHGVKL